MYVAGFIKSEGNIFLVLIFVWERHQLVWEFQNCMQQMNFVWQLEELHVSFNHLNCDIEHFFASKATIITGRNVVSGRNEINS